MRPFIEWRDEWDLDIEEVDDEHRELVSLLNHLVECHRCATRSGRGGRRSAAPATIEQMLLGLGEHVRHHFRHEEEYMERCGYPDRLDHAYEHTTLVAEYTELMRDVQHRGLECLDRTTLNELKNWLIIHIAGADRHFGEYYREYVLGLPDRERDSFTRLWMDRPPGE